MTDPRELVGRWSLRRRLVDRRAGGYGQVVGTLDIQEKDDEVHWNETGELTWAGRVFPVYRNLRVRRQEDGWWMLFEDGRPFHPWRPGVRVTHPCAADVYEGLIDVDRAGTRMRILWDVTGPTKSQRLVTRLYRG